MNKNKLYFIPILAEAFDNESPIPAIKNAIMKIIELGHQEKYAEGYKQFEEFINIGYERESEEEKKILEIDITDVLRRIIVKARLGTDKSLNLDELVQKIKSNKNINEEFCDIIDELEKEITYELELYKNDDLISSKILCKNDIIKFQNVEPGFHEIKLSNGRQLWNGDLTEKDLLWGKAFPKKEYQMAAATGEGNDLPSKTFTILNDEILVEIYPGFESGTIQIKVID